MREPDWRQYNLEFAQPHDAERVFATPLALDLEAAQQAGLLDGWWFIRKHPWKLRFKPTPSGTKAVPSILDSLTARGQLAGAVEAIYEPEVTAFGGPEGMQAAHLLFYRDSRHLMARAAATDGANRGRRETTILLAHALMRGAGLDWYEQGDVWAKFAELREAEAIPGGETRTALVTTMRRLMCADPRALTRPGLLLDGHDEWITAFEEAGQTLARLARHGQLQRGLRSILAHHLVFHANRAGLAITDQTAMACLALNIVFALPGDVAHRTATEKDVRVTDLDLTADELRTALAETLVDQGAIKSARVEAALRRLPRHQFLPGVDLDEVYGNVAVYTKADATGTSISAASQPIIVVRQLEQLDLQPGETVFEAGAGTGINAGYMALIVGPEGKVYTVDFDSDIVDGARKGLANAEINNVEVILGDGALGLPEAAPFNKIIATVGAHEVPSAWLQQLAPGGRLVVPVRLRGTASRSIAFERIADRWRSVSSELCVFMPLRGIGDDARRYVDLTEGVTLQVHRDQRADAELLAQTLDTDRYETWTGVVFGVNVSFEWMELWLACTMPNSLMRMNVQREQPGSAKVTPMFGWGSMTTVQNRSLAYLTLRKLDCPDSLYEVGVVGHGSDGAALADEVAHQVIVWDKNFRGREARFEMPDYPETADASVGRFVLDRPRHPITVIWE